MFKICMFGAFLFNPACAKVPVRTTNSHAQSRSPASCRSKRVDDHSRFYAHFTDFRGGTRSTSGTSGTKSELDMSRRRTQIF